jgi:hypothetical protein
MPDTTRLFMFCSIVLQAESDVKNKDDVHLRFGLLALVRNERDSAWSPAASGTVSIPRSLSQSELNQCLDLRFGGMEAQTSPFGQPSSRAMDEKADGHQTKRFTTIT